MGNINVPWISMDAMGKRWWMFSQTRGWSSIHERWNIMLVEQEDSPSPSHHHLYGWDSNHPTMNVFVAWLRSINLYTHEKNNVTKGVMTVPRIPCWNPGSFGGMFFFFFRSKIWVLVSWNGDINNIFLGIVTWSDGDYPLYPWNQDILSVGIVK